MRYSKINKITRFKSIWPLYFMISLGWSTRIKKKERGQTAESNLNSGLYLYLWTYLRLLGCSYRHLNNSQLHIHLRREFGDKGGRQPQRQCLNVPQTGKASTTWGSPLPKELSPQRRGTRKAKQKPCGKVHHHPNKTEKFPKAFFSMCIRSSGRRFTRFETSV